MQDNIRKLMSMKCRNIYQDRIQAIKQRKHRNSFHMGDPAHLQAIMNIRKEPGLQKQSILVRQPSLSKPEEALLKKLPSKLVSAWTPSAIEGYLALFQ